jgi:acetyltransferase EpsM
LREIKTKKVIIIGGEGNGGVVASCVDDNRNRFGDMEYSVYGFLNDVEEGEINGYPILGGTDQVTKYAEQGYYFMYAIHMIGRNYLSEKVYKKCDIPPSQLATIIHKTAFVAPNAVIEPGCLIMSNCYIGPAARIGKSSLVMANALIGHNTNVGMLCHFSVGSITSSYVEIGKVSDVTLGAKVLEKRKIGDYAVAGAGSLITRNIGDGEIHIGSPAKYYKDVLKE